MKWSIAIVAMLATSMAAHAGSPFNEQSEAEKRRVVVPFIRQLTGCVARNALADSSAVAAYRSGTLSPYLGRQLQSCPNEMSTLLGRYEDTYGYGSAEQFIKGPYLADLSRAVLSIIRPQLDSKVAEQKRFETAIQAENALEEAENLRKQEEARLATIRLRADQKAAESKAALEKQGRIDVAMRTTVLLRDKFYDCADHQLAGLVKSGETAEVLANAAITLCGQSLGDVQEAALQVAKAKEESGDPDIMREQIRALVKERVAADAVQAKAGVGAFSSPGQY